VERGQGTADDPPGQGVNPVAIGVHLRARRDLRFHFPAYCRHELANSLAEGSGRTGGGGGFEVEGVYWWLADEEAEDPADRVSGHVHPVPIAGVDLPRFRGVLSVWDQAI
jgi:hypothetical protein